MANKTIDSYNAAVSIDGAADQLLISQATVYNKINRNTLLSLASAPVGLTDTQVLTNKTLTSPTINGGTLSGTLIGTYTLGGTPTFPASVITLTGTQVLTNKTLTSPTITSPTITNASISADVLTGFTVPTSGTVYGMPITLGAISGSVLSASSVPNTALATGIQSSKLFNPYKFSVYRNAALNTGSSTTALVTFDTKNYDTSSNYSTATGGFVAPIAGFYHFTSTISLTCSARLYISIFKNGGEVYHGQDITVSSFNVITVSADLQLVASDNIQIYGYYGTTAAAYNVGTAFMNFSGYLVSAT